MTKSLRATTYNPSTTPPTPPSPSSKKKEVQTLVTTLLELHRRLSHERSLEPSPRVNALFNDLVRTCLLPLPAVHAEAVFAHDGVGGVAQELRGVCAEGEFRLEMAWARRVVGAKSAGEALTTLRSFPYYTNYIDLSLLELNTLLAVADAPPKNIVFLGSGPLPLSSFCLLQHLRTRTNSRLPSSLYPSPRSSPNSSPSSGSTTPKNIRIHNVDRDASAITVSSAWMRAVAGAVPELLGEEGEMTFETAEAARVDLAAFDVVFLAGLVGMSREVKRQVLKEMVGGGNGLREGALVVVRSAYGLRRLLYQEVETDLLREVGLEVLVVVHPANHIVNSIIVARYTGFSTE